MTRATTKKLTDSLDISISEQICESNLGKPFIFARNRPHNPSYPYCQGGSSCGSAASARGKQGWTMGWRCSHSQGPWPWTRCGVDTESSAGGQGTGAMCHPCLQCSGMGVLQNSHQSKTCLQPMRNGNCL